jgi:hypothetical protein
MSRYSCLKEAFQLGKEDYFENKDKNPKSSEKLNFLLERESIFYLCDKLIIYREWTRGYSIARRRLTDVYIKALNTML